MAEVVPINISSVRLVTTDVPYLGDFSVDERGRINLVDGDLAYVQRLVRRILTTPRLFDRLTNTPISIPDYIFEPTFGAGVRRMVHSTISKDELQRLITEQIVADPETSKNVRPEITIIADELGTVVARVIAARLPNVTIAFSIPFPSA